MTVAVDTNILVRLLVADDGNEARRAEALFRGNTVLIVTTVLLETEWVLRSAYGFDRKEIAHAFSRLLGLPQVVANHPDVVRMALAGYEGGMDFADALHLASASRAERFATFDRQMRKRAKCMPGAIKIIEP